jgi:hypothetical protein
VWIDIGIAAALAGVTIIMGYLGVHVTLHPQESPTARRWYKAGFIACALVAVCLVVLQGMRNGKAQYELKRAVEAAAAAAQQATTRIDQLTGDQRKEVARREQAEKDLAIIVQSSGKAIREGVAEDIKKSPIAVSVTNGAKISPEDDAKFAEQIEKMVSIGSVLQKQFIETYDIAAVKSQWVKWTNDTTASLHRLAGASYVIQFKNAHGSAMMGCPTAHSIEVCGYWQDIQGKKDSLSSMLTELRHGH